MSYFNEEYQLKVSGLVFLNYDVLSVCNYDVLRLNFCFNGSATHLTYMSGILFWNQYIQTQIKGCAFTPENCIFYGRACVHYKDYSCVSPKTGAEPEEEEEAVALSEAGQEGEDQVDGEDVDQTLPPPHLITQAPPHQRPDHHGYIHQQTCKYTHRDII